MKPMMPFPKGKSPTMGQSPVGDALEEAGETTPDAETGPGEAAVKRPFTGARKKAPLAIKNPAKAVVAKRAFAPKRKKAAVQTEGRHTINGRFTARGK